MTMDKAARPPYLTVLSLSALILFFEILLIDMFALVYWYNFSSMLISLALLGFAASGTYIYKTRAYWQRYTSTFFELHLLGFALSAFLSVVFANRLGFNPLLFIWQHGELFKFIGIYFILMLPFFFAASIIAFSLSFWKENAPKIYAANLLGSGLGGLTAFLAISQFAPQPLLKATSILICLCLTLYYLERGQGNRPGAMTGFFLALLVLLVPGHAIHLKTFAFKDATSIYQYGQPKTIYQGKNIYGELSVIENKTVPFYFAPGLSLQTQATIPKQWAVLNNGDLIGFVTANDRQKQNHGFLSAMTASVGYELIKDPKVLILGTGGGLDVLQADHYNARQIVAVDENPKLKEILTKVLVKETDGIYTAPHVQLLVESPRHYLQQTQAQYDLIVLSTSRSATSFLGGASGLNSDFLYTEEAMGKIWQKLTDRGYASFTLWSQLPPRAEFKIVSLLLNTLKAAGITEPENHFLMIRNWNTFTVLLSKQPISEEVIEQVEQFNQKHLFDWSYYPGMTKAQAAKFHQLDEPFYFQGIQKLIAKDNSQFMNDYQYDIGSVSDNRPYFFDVFRWQTAWQLMGSKNAAAKGMMDWSMILLFVVVSQAIIFGFVFILAPLTKVQFKQHRWMLTYFFMIGIGFLLLEIVLITKLQSIFVSPLMAISFIITSLLVFSALGSWTMGQWPHLLAGRQKLFSVVFLTIAFGFFVLLTLMSPWLYQLSALSQFIVITMAMLPLGLVMGMPFPSGLMKVSQDNEAMLPWCWGVNGCASVIAAPLATVLMIHWGLWQTVVIALLCYAVAFASLKQC